MFVKILIYSGFNSTYFFIVYQMDLDVYFGIKI